MSEMTPEWGNAGFNLANSKFIKSSWISSHLRHIEEKKNQKI